MYPGLDEGSNDNNPYSQPKQNQPKKGGMPKDIQIALFDVKGSFTLKSVKPFFSGFEIYFQMNVKNIQGNSIPIRLVFLQTYPNDKPRIYVGRALGHKIINEINGQIMYGDLIHWTAKTRLLDVLNKIQTILNTSEIKEDPFTHYVQDYKRRLQQYAREVNNLTNTPIPPNPAQPFLPSIKVPQPPVFNFQYLIKEKKYNSQLYNDVQDKIQIYNTLVVDYKENESKAKYISQRFGKGRILRQMETAMENAEPDTTIQGIQNQLADFHAKRKNYHRLDILKQKYLDS